MTQPTKQEMHAALDDLRTLDCHTEESFNELENAQADAAQFLIEHIDTIRAVLQNAVKEE